MLIALIAACEIGFWVLVLGGLAARYVLRLRRLSTILLLLVPLLDVILVSASLLDVARGNPPGTSHGLAALYLGFTVVFGHSVIRWADRVAARRFGGAQVRPTPGPYGTAAVVAEWREWGKLLLVWAMTLVLLWVTAQIAGTPVPSLTTWYADPLWYWGIVLAPLAIIWFLGWPLWTTLAPPKPSRVAPVTSQRQAQESADDAFSKDLEWVFGRWK